MEIVAEPRGQYSRGYLRHEDHPGLLQFITFRLADSVPKELLESWEAELASLTEGVRKLQMQSRINKYLDRCYGSCLSPKSTRRRDCH